MDEATLNTFIDIMGDGSLTVLAELNAVLEQLTPEQQHAFERFVDMIATSVKVAFKHAGAEFDAALEANLGKFLKNAEAEHERFIEGYAVGVSVELMRRGMKHDELMRILDAANKRARTHVKSATIAVGQ